MKKYTKILVSLGNKKISLSEWLIYLFNLLFSFWNYGFLGKLVFAEPFPKDNEAATWREKLDQIYKSSSQSFRVVVHGSKVWIVPSISFSLST